MDFLKAFQHLQVLISTAFAAGAAGAIVSLASANDDTRRVTFLGVVKVVLVGGLTAQFSEPVFVAYIPAFATFGAFVLGLTAIFVVSGVLHVAKQFATDPLGTLSRLRGKKK